VRIGYFWMPISHARQLLLTRSGSYSRFRCSQNFKTIFVIPCLTL
jgi:hypothetical protein